jgi:uncharacterized integral membrane protein (TIGR00697 family)
MVHPTIFEKKHYLFIVLAGLFITSAITAELISNKLIEIPLSFQLGDWKFGPFVTIVGILPWPIVFLLTDLINEFYGPKVISRLSWITAGLIFYCFIIIGLSLLLPAVELPNSGLSDNKSYNLVFGQAQMVIIGSIAAFLVSQLLDATIFTFIKNRTGNKYIWLRSTGSTMVSQLIDSFIVLYIGFVLPGKMSFSYFLSIAPTNYILKLIIAVSLTPLIYLGHWWVKKNFFSFKDPKVNALKS